MPGKGDAPSLPFEVDLPARGERPAGQRYNSRVFQDFHLSAVLVSSKGDSMTDELTPFRRRIDECDEKIVRMINERLKVCREVGELKSAQGIAVRIPEREEEVIAKAIGLNDGPCPPEVLEKIFRILIDTAVALEESLDSARPEQ